MEVGICGRTVGRGYCVRPINSVKSIIFDKTTGRIRGDWTGSESRETVRGKRTGIDSAYTLIRAAVWSKDDNIDRMVQGKSLSSNLYSTSRCIVTFRVWTV